jgi:hypothetical protein
MDDQQGNVFDGTVRSREWRRRRQNARAEADAAEPRSDAPKSIAGSLMVPAHMLDGSLPADQPATRNQRAALQRGTTTVVDGTSGAERSRRNPFLVPPAETAEPRSKPGRWGVISGLLERSFACIRTHPGSALLWGPRMVARHLAVAPRSARRLAVAAFAAAILVTVVIASQSGTRHSSSERKVRAAGLLGASGTDVLSASSNPLVQRAAQHDRAPHHVRPIHPRRTTLAHRRPRRATKHVVVAARYTPSTSSTASYTPSSTSSSYAGSGSTPVSSQSTGGATTSSSSSGSSRPAFGEHGILGPGRGAANTQ